MARAISDEEVQLKRRARRRLIGAIVLVTAIVVALPMVLDTEPKPIGGEVSIKIPSPDSGTFASRVVPVTPPGETKSEPAARHATEPKAAPKVAAAPTEKPVVTPAPAVTPGADSAPPPKKAQKPAEPPAAATTEAPDRADKAAARKPQPSPSKEVVSPPFVVQVVALADAEKAKQVQAQIAAAGIKAYTEVVKTKKGDVTRVRAGPFPTRAAAEKAQDQLKAAGLSGNIVAK